MDTEIEQLVDTVWISSVDRMIKKEVAPIRPGLGDFIDLYVPQIRTLLLMEANPSTARLIYNAAYTAANRNTYVIMKKLGMPADYFWKFEYWPRDRAFETLRKVINKVFSTMMNRNKEGGLELEGVEIEPVRFTIAFKDCAECAGVTADKAVCYYHTATFAGILASLLNKEMDGFESKCRGRGDDCCVVVVGKRDDSEIKTRVNDYLAPAKVATKLDERLNHCLQGDQLRTIGNLVDIGYQNLIFMSSLSSGSEPALKSNLDVGKEYGIKLAPLIAGYYQDNSLEVIKKYYNQLHQFDVKSIEKIGSDIDVVLNECAEVTVKLKKNELLNFIFGELQGLVSSLLNQSFSYKESILEDSGLRIKFTPLA